MMLTTVRVVHEENPSPYGEIIRFFLYKPDVFPDNFLFITRIQTKSLVKMVLEVTVRFLFFIKLVCLEEVIVN